MPSIHLHNKGSEHQEFEVHGWIQNKNVTVAPGAVLVIETPHKSSGAIIALHEGHEGEQVEITKDGYGGNDTFDVSVIVGAGGNMTAQQVNDPSTRKGHPTFMQACNDAYHRASPQDKKNLEGQVFLDPHGHVKRINAPKNNKALEDFVRRFAEGRVYIGVGAWQGSGGDKGDNDQSSAAHGNKDILITYSNGDASPDPPHHAQPPARHEALVHQANLAPHPGPEAAKKEPGVDITNKSHKPCTYYFFENLWNGNGTAGANFNNPMTHITLQPNTSGFVPLKPTFKGRVQRGKDIPATWGEFQLSASNDHAAHGDISLEQGCDGAAEVHATDGSGRMNGFNIDVLEGAPHSILQARGDGEKAIKSTMGNWMGGRNQEAIDYLHRRLGTNKAYIVGGTGVDDVASHDQRLHFIFY